MSVTENRIVKMIFDNAQFKKAATETSGQLSALDKQVATAGKGTGLLDMGKAMDTVKVKASAMQVATVTAIANIANRAVNAGITLAKSLSIDPIKQGFDEYELKMKSIQTILANTKGENLASVTKALNELNTYSDKTIYNFANMTENIGKLTTAGISLKDSTAVVKGFHNMVALAGGDATAAAGAMEQFGQGLQAGTIKAIDWMSISNRGLGSQSLQKAFFETARAVGSLSDVPLTTTFEEWTKSQGGFKASLEQGWLTSDVATQALSNMTGDVKSVQELMKQGFSEQAAKDLLEIANNATESATKVRTFTAFLDTTKEAIASGWGQVMEVIFGDFNESTALFTKLSNIVNGTIGKFFDYVMALVKGFDEFGGRIAIMETLKNIMSPIVAIVGLLAKGFKALFGDGEAGEGLATFAKALQHITRPLRILGQLISGQLTPLEALHRLFTVVSHAARNLARWLGGFAKPLGDFISMKVPGGDGVIQFIKDLAREIGKAIDRIKELIDSGAGIGDIFGGMSFDMPSLPSLPSIGSIFGGGDAAAPIAGLAGGIDAITGKVSDLKDETEGGLFNPDAKLDTSRISDTGDSVDTLREKLGTTKDEAQSVGEFVGNLFDGLGGRIMDALKGLSMDDLMASFNLAVLSTFLISISRFFNTLSKSFAGFVGTGEAINGVLEQAGNALGSFQTAARAKLITAIAIAIGILAVSLWLLSKIPMDKMVSGLFGMAGIMLIMKVGVDSISKAAERMEGKGTALKLTGLSLALLALGFAVLTLSAAFLILEKVDWSAMLKGLITIVVVMKSIEKLGDLGKNAAKNMMAGAFAISAIAGSMLLLAGALLLFKLVDWESMLKAGLVIGVLTVVLTLLGKVPAEALAKAGGAMLATSVGMLALANALLIFGLVEWDAMIKAGVALAALTASLAVLSIVGNPVTVAGVIGLSLAMIGLATAGLIFNKVDWSSIGKLALVLGILVVAFAGFLAVMTIFTPVLVVLSAFAGSLALLALAITGLTLAFALVFPLLAMGAGAFAAFATGAAVAFAVFIQTLALQAPIIKDSFLKILQTLIDGIVEAVPMVIDGVKRLWEAIKNEFSGGGGGGGKQAFMGQQGKSWIEKLGDGISKMIPAIVKKGAELLGKFLVGLASRAKSIGAKGAELVANLINGIASRIGGVVDAAVNLVVKFAAGLGANLGKIVTAGIKLISDFLHALAAGIRGGAGAIGGGIKDVLDAMRDVGVDMVKGLMNGIGDMFDDAMGKIGDLASGMINKAKGILKIFSPSRVFKSIGKFLVEGLTQGIQENAASAITSVASMVGGQIAVASQYMSEFVQQLDQQAIAAQAKADGLARAAETARKLADQAASAADKTKGKGDDKRAKKSQNAAEKLADKADAATKAATRAEERAAAAVAAEERKAQFAEADTFDKAKMRSEDAQASMDAAKLAERRAAASLTEARALERQAKADGVSKKQRREMLKQAEELRKAAERQAKGADTALAEAQAAAADALRYQRQAGDEAAAAFQKQFEKEAQDDAAADAFEKMSLEEKAAERRRQAAALQAQAEKDLAEAKVLAYTDLEAANDLAQQAMEQADRARDYLKEAADYDNQIAQGTGQVNADTGSRVVNLDATEAAAIAFNKFNDTYSDAAAAAAAGSGPEFNQYITSPEALPPSEIYRHTHNLFSFAADRLQPTP